MATQPKIPMRAVRTIFGTPVPKQHFPEKATQTFKKGAPCYVGTDGYMTECGADPALYMGLATKDGMNAASDALYDQIVELCAPGVLFRGYLDSSGGETTGVGTQAKRTQAHGIAKSATGGIWYVDTADTTDDIVVIWQYWDGDGNLFGDIRTHALFSWVITQWQGNVGY
jgi:hypothetical protein